LFPLWLCLQFTQIRFE